MLHLRSQPLRRSLEAQGLKLKGSKGSLWTHVHASPAAPPHVSTNPPSSTQPRSRCSARKRTCASPRLSPPAARRRRVATPAGPAAAALPAGHSKPQPRSLASCSTAEEAAVARDLGWIWLWKRNTSLRQHAALNFPPQRWVARLRPGPPPSLRCALPMEPLFP